MEPLTLVVGLVVFTFLRFCKYLKNEKNENKIGQVELARQGSVLVASA